MPSVLQFRNHCSTASFLIGNHHLLLEVNPKDLAGVPWQSVTLPGRNTSPMLRVLQVTHLTLPTLHLSLLHAGEGHRGNPEKSQEQGWPRASVSEGAHATWRHQVPLGFCATTSTNPSTF